MKLGYAIHEIRLSADVTVVPNSTAEFSDKQYDELSVMGAIKEPSPDQIALWNLQNPQEQAPAPLSVEPAKGKKAKVETTVAPQQNLPEPDADKEVTEI